MGARTALTQVWGHDGQLWGHELRSHKCGGTRQLWGHELRSHSSGHKGHVKDSTVASCPDHMHGTIHPSHNCFPHCTACPT